MHRAGRRRQGRGNEGRWQLAEVVVVYRHGGRASEDAALQAAAYTG